MSRLRRGIGGAQDVDQPLVSGVVILQQRRVCRPVSPDELTRVGETAGHDLAPEVLHLAHVPHRVGDRPSQAELDGCVEVAGRSVGQAA